MKGKTPLALTLIVLVPVFAAAGFFLRRWQVDTAFEPVTGLLTPGRPATYALAALLAVAALTALGLALRLLRGDAPKGYLANLAAPNLGVGILIMLAGALLFAGGVLGVRDYALRMNERGVRLMLGLCLAASGVCVGLVGLLGQQRQEGKGRFFGPLLAPAFCACVWVLATYQGHIANPNMMEYVFLVLGVLCVILACYAMASAAFEKPRPVLCAFFSAMGVILLMVSAADRPWGMDALAIWGFALYLFAQLTCLLSCRMCPPELEEWTAPPKEEEVPEESLENQVQPRGEEDE